MGVFFWDEIDAWELGGFGWGLEGLGWVGLGWEGGGEDR